MKFRVRPCTAATIEGRLARAIELFESARLKRPAGRHGPSVPVNAGKEQKPTERYVDGRGSWTSAQWIPPSELRSSTAGVLPRRGASVDRKATA